MAESAGEKRKKCRVLVAPLDWGLGHATRCVPIIKELLSQGCEVWLAGEGSQESLLKSEFPNVPFLALPGYRIRYAGSRHGFFWKIVIQLPRILYAIRSERIWLKKMVKDHRFDAVVSDSRFGLRNSKTLCIFITHQLAIKSPLGRWSEKILQRWNYSFINRFSECWVPDFAGEINLAGELSHPSTKPNLPVKYIGPISRLDDAGTRETREHILLIISGPEPQRTFLENKFVDEISHYPATATVIRGLPSALSIIPSTGMIKFYNHLAAEELNEEMQRAAYVIGRCGYSTVMDVIKLQKKSVLIPTPGQTEQEYLAKHLLEKKIAFTVEQNKFSLNKALGEANKFNYLFFPHSDQNDLHSAIMSLNKTIEKKRG